MQIVGGDVLGFIRTGLRLQQLPAHLRDIPQASTTPITPGAAVA
ncbi:hypothetical protein HMPREF1522_0236 [Actinomyces sp. ICM54]|nr:hypothetical protein HMPREF1522_0236 [Actinomyces sp. ICM54]